MQYIASRNGRYTKDICDLGIMLGRPNYFRICCYIMEKEMDLVGVPVIYYDMFATDIKVETLWETLPFNRLESVPRNECWMNDYSIPYTYGRGNGIRTYTASEWHPFVNEHRKLLNNKFGLDFNCCFCNGYLSEQDHLGWHADDSPEMDSSHPIASISFGAEREIWFRKNGEKGPATKGILMKHRSVVLMNAGMQESWQHRIPKHSASCGKRISMTFRKLKA